MKTGQAGIELMHRFEGKSLKPYLCPAHIWTVGYGHVLYQDQIKLPALRKDGYKIKVDYSGLYNLQFSLQLVNTNTQIHDVDVWIRKNGSDVAGSNSKFSVPNSHGGTDGHLIAALNYYIELAKDDYVHLAWATNSVQVTIEQLPTQSSPTRPATPSAIITLQYLSANSYTTNLFTEPYISSQSQGTATISHPANTGTNKVYRN